MDAPKTLTLEADLPAELAPRLARHPAISALRSGRGRGAAEERVWHDTAEGALGAEGMVLEARRGARTLIRTLPRAGDGWCPGTPLDAHGATAAGRPDPRETAEAPLVPIAAFSGRRQVLPLGAVQAVLLYGHLRTVAVSRDTARLQLTGPPSEATATMRALAEALPLLPPGAALAEEGRALARGETPRPRRRGAPDLSFASSVEDALARAIGHLLDVALAQAPVAIAGVRPEGVHQLRVALRRLRSALRVFRSAIDAESLHGFDAELRLVLNALGPARDWDVWLGEAGTALERAMPGERRIAKLLAAAQEERAKAYDRLREMLQGPRFRALIWDGIAVVHLQSWRAGASDDALAALAGPLGAFAAPLLARRWKRLRRDARGLRDLDAHALHELRLDAKRLRYAAEMFAPLWPGKGTRRFLRRLSALQEVLGLANDAAVARALVAPLGTVPSLRWAVGVAEGWAAARTIGIREDVIAAWSRLSGIDPFWPEA